MGQTDWPLAAIHRNVAMPLAVFKDLLTFPIIRFTYKLAIFR